MKIKNITVRNFKAVSEQELNLNGASVIVTAGNNKGKTSVLRGLVDRFRGDRPEIIVKDGEEKGENHIELTDGSKIGWSFTKKTENFYFTTPDDIKMTTGVLSAIGEKYFGQKFDIEKFLQSSRTEQTKQVQKLLGIDLADLDEKYKGVFDKRTDANREVKRLLALDKKKPEPVDVPDIEALKKEKSKVQEENQT
jgi:predicted ATP-dependent endonuclease of OLD family